MDLYGGGLVAKSLKRFGLQQLFSLPGHQILSVYDACLDEGLELISTRHEASAVYMAQALAYIKREPGVALLAGGPGLTNALTGIAQAHFSNTPLVVIGGTNTLQKRDKGFPQDMDQLELVRPFTKWARGCYDIRRIPEYIATAYRHAIRGRPGPVYLEIPYDLMETKVEDGSVVFPEKPTRLRSRGDQKTLDKLVGILEWAKKPIAIAGSGVLWSGAEKELSAFIKKTKIPLLLTTGALATPFSPDQVLGLGSMGAGRASMETISEADLIILLGTRLNFLLGFGQPPFIQPDQKIVQIDVSAEEIDSNRRVDLGILGDLRTNLVEINKVDLSIRDLDRWNIRLLKKYVDFETELSLLAERSDVPMHPMRLVTEVESQRTEDSLLVLDGANSILWALLGARIHERGGIVISTMGDLEAIGAGVPQALALKQAYPDRQVMLHTGDGSLGYGFMELETAVRYNIPIVVVVHNDQGWGMTRDMQVEFFGKNRELGNQLGLVRYDRMVIALGGHGEFVERPEQLRPALERAIQANCPSLVNVMVDPDPKSPGLMMFMLMEVMLGKQTSYDKIPEWMRKLKSLKLDGSANKIMLRFLDRMLHKDMG